MVNPPKLKSDLVAHLRNTICHLSKWWQTPNFSKEYTGVLHYELHTSHLPSVITIPALPNTAPYPLSSGRTEWWTILKDHHWPSRAYSFCLLGILPSFIWATPPHPSKLDVSTNSSGKASLLNLPQIPTALQFSHSILRAQFPTYILSPCTLSTHLSPCLPFEAGVDSF